MMYYRVVAACSDRCEFPACMFSFDISRTKIKMLQVNLTEPSCVAAGHGTVSCPP